MLLAPTRSSLFVALTFAATAAMAQGRGQDAARNPVTFDDLQVRVAERAPAFGGLFVDETTNSLYVYSWNRTAAGAAEVEGALQTTFGAALPPGRIKLLQGQYGFKELKQWHDGLTGVLSMPGVVLTDINDAKNRLTVGVESVEASWRVRDRLGALGIPGEAVDAVVVPPVRLEVSLRDRNRPLVGGLQLSYNYGGYQYLCTEGFNAVRATVPGFVVNSHCSGIQGGIQSVVMYQPFVTGVNRVGVEIIDPPYFTGSPCPTGRKCRRSDSAFIRRDSGVAASQGRIARPPLNSYNWNPIDTFRIVREADPVVGQTMTKVGRTTGRTTGVVTLVCATVNVSDSTITQLCQAKASYNSAGGDSGSPVFRVLNSPAANDVALAGIHWGSTGFFSTISQMQRSTSPVELGPLTTCASGFTC